MLTNQHPVNKAESSSQPSSGQATAMPTRISFKPFARQLYRSGHQGVLAKGNGFPIERKRPQNLRPLKPCAKSPTFLA